MANDSDYLALNLSRQVAAAVNAELERILVGRGIDPADRTDGWRGRARAALGNLKIETTCRTDDSDCLSVHAETFIRMA